MIRARQNEAIAPQNMTWPIVEKAYASSSSPRSVVPGRRPAQGPLLGVVGVGERQR